MIPENPSGYNPNIPQPFDIPAQTSQPGFLTDFGTLNEYYGVDHVPFGNTITLVASTPGVTTFTSPAHGLVGGETVQFSHLATITPPPVVVVLPWTLNGTSAVITYIDPNTFSIAVDTTAEQPYEPNSGDFTVTSGGFPYGYHKQLSFNAPIGTPNIPPTSEAIYTKLFRQVPTNLFTPELDFLNILGEVILTDAFIFQKTPNGQGFVTPWNMIINMGDVVVPNPGPLTVTFPIPFKSVVYTVIAQGNGPPGSKLRWGVAAVTLTSFNITVAPPLPGLIFGGPAYYIAIGR